MWICVFKSVPVVETSFRGDWLDSWIQFNLLSSLNSIFKAHVALVVPLWLSVAHWLLWITIFLFRSHHYQRTNWSCWIILDSWLSTVMKDFNCSAFMVYIRNKELKKSKALLHKKVTTGKEIVVLLGGFMNNNTIC
jgi:hypothetical protein